MLYAQTEVPAPPAGGAAIGEVIIAFAITLAATLPTIWLMWRETAGKPTAIGRLADWVATKDRLPRWVGLPSYALVVSLLTAGFGVWWDVALHMQNGRDEGPLANPSHYPIFLALLAIFNIGIISAVLAKGELPRRTIAIGPAIRAPLGSIVIIGAGVIALAGFPSDDLWHRLFGQDVTEWGPTHVMMIGGAVTCVIGLALLQAEARQVGAAGAMGFGGRLRGAIMLSLCIVPFAFLMEFDLGVPQFPMATQFIIVGFLAGWIFTGVRAYFGPGGALLAWVVYLIAHLILLGSTALVDDVLLARFLLLLPAAILVEIVALVVSPRRGLTFWITSGVLIGTLGLAAEWVWSQFFMPLPQPIPGSALPLMLAVGTAAAVGGGLLGSWHVRQLQDTASRPDTDDELTFDAIADLLRRFKLTFLVGPGESIFGYWKRGQTGTLNSNEIPWRRHGAGLLGMGLFIGLMAAYTPQDPIDFEARVALDYVDGAAETCGTTTSKCTAFVTVDVEPVNIAEDGKIWFYALAWQGRHRSADVTTLPRDPIADVPGIMRVEMVPTGVTGQYRSAEPLPLYGSWKTLVRLHTAPTNMSALPLYAPDDPAITADKGRRILVTDGQRVDAMTEPGFLQREIKDDVPAWLWTAAYIVVGLFWLGLIALYGWCLAAAAKGGATPVRTDTDKPVAPPSKV
ncbi:ABC transporter permease [Antrihabitans sp. YC3-6]|uniref:ABC transporter permease n=1 Tax=Antrihabitans stalagmiti TaxID=2799499 RepID=A0A934NMI1_9NOCA|nr:ABC transporter permease [Antrihabitans stalagmiti]MBJ8337939.1 ABC transporter permease [Antrihabitans stalagmiti]